MTIFKIVCVRDIYQQMGSASSVLNNAAVVIEQSSLIYSHAQKYPVSQCHANHIFHH